MSNINLVIKDITTTAVIAPLDRPITNAVATISAAPLILIDVTCSGGIIGRAYLFGYTPVTLRPLINVIKNLNELLVGKKVEPFKLYQEMSQKFRLLGRQGLLGMALAGLDMAFWDALGKSCNMSVAKLLGGDKDPVTCYDSYGFFDPALSPKDLEHTLELGFKAVKFKIGGGELKSDIDALSAIRNIVGNDIKLMVDYNQSLNAPEAIMRIQHLAQFDLHWVEEPVIAEDFIGHRTVRNASSVAIQTGENWWFPEDVARAVDAEISDFAMLDIMKIGGITGWREAAAIAKSASLPVSSHLFIEASSHVMGVTPGSHMLEYLDVASAILTQPYEVKEGTLTPQGPGLGIDWNSDAVEKYLA